MKARKYKTRISHLLHRRFNSNFIWQSAEDRAWDRMAPVGREFGSPDYERLMQEDFDRQEGIFAPPDLPIQERQSLMSLKGMLTVPKGLTVSMEDMNPCTPGSKGRR